MFTGVCVFVHVFFFSCCSSSNGGSAPRRVSLKEGRKEGSQEGPPEIGRPIHNTEKVFFRAVHVATINLLLGSEVDRNKRSEL